MIESKRTRSAAIHARWAVLAVAAIAPACSGSSSVSDDAAVDVQSDVIAQRDASTDTGSSDGSATRGCPLPAYPDETCTGVPPGTALQRVPADVTDGPGWSWRAADGCVTITDDNTVFDGKDVAGCILVDGVGVTVRNSRAESIGTRGRARDPANPRLTIEDTEVVCPAAGMGGTAIGDLNINVRRANIHGCENGFDIDSDATIEDSYIHDLFQSMVAHTDGIQSAASSNLVINHNRIYADTPGACGDPSGHTADCGGNAAMITGGTAPSNTTISNNLIAGGGYTLYCPRSPTTNFRVVNNRWSTIFYAGGGAFGTSDGCAGIAEWSGNAWFESGMTITAQ